MLPVSQVGTTSVHGARNCALTYLIQILSFVSALSFPLLQANPFRHAKDPWAGLADHCKDARPISGSEFLQRQHKLAQALHELNASAYIAEPGASAQFFGNVSSSSWTLSDRPLLLMISPVVQADRLMPKVTVLTPYFEEAHAKQLNVPGLAVTYVSWKDDEDPYVIGVKSISPSTSLSRIYVDEMIRHFIVDGFQNVAPEAHVVLAPPEITSLRSRKTLTELALLQCANEVGQHLIRTLSVPQTKLH